MAYADVPRALSYPFAGLGKYGFVPACALYLAIELVLSAFLPAERGVAPPVASDPAVIILVYSLCYLPGSTVVLALLGPLLAALLAWVAGLLGRIAADSASGGRYLPDWPGVGALREESIPSFLRIAAAAALYLVPAGIAFAQDARGPFIIACVLGLALFPMAVLAAFMQQNLLAANPVTVVRAIARVPLDYGLMIGVLFVLFMGMWYCTLCLHAIPFLGRALSILASLFYAVVAMRIIGVFYACCGDRLQWFRPRDGADEQDEVLLGIPDDDLLLPGDELRLP